MSTPTIEYRGFTIEWVHGVDRLHPYDNYAYYPTDYDGEPLRFESTVEACKRAIDEEVDET